MLTCIRHHYKGDAAPTTAVGDTALMSVHANEEGSKVGYNNNHAASTGTNTTSHMEMLPFPSPSSSSTEPK